MSNPQTENGYTRIANELMDILISTDISSQEMRAALFVIRKTYGYNKKEDFIALSQFQKALNISKTRASQIINSLVNKNILTVTENINGLTKKYLFNKHFKKWTTVKEKRNRYVKTQDTVKVLRKTPLRKSVTTKESITKDTSTKDIVIPDWIPLEEWEEFVKMRKNIKKPISGYAMKLAINKLGKLREAGSEPREVLGNSIMNSYQGLFPVDKNNKKGYPSLHEKNQAALESYLNDELGKEKDITP
jgi:phage replication O-like protein O